jgi:transposase
VALFKLKSHAYNLLREIARSNPNARQVRRAQALLWLHENHPASVVAQRLGMSWRTIQRWKRQYQEQAQDPVLARIQEGQHTGRLPQPLRLARKEIERVWRHDPRRYGFRACNWTVPMLRCLIHRHTKTSVSRSTVRRALRSLHYRYKRPRLTLARRSPTWRQEKGGSNTVSKVENARFVCSLTRPFSMKFRRCGPCGPPSVNKPRFPSSANIVRSAF